MNWEVGAIDMSTDAPAPIMPSATFNLGDRVVVVNGPANVRQSPGGILLGQQQDGSSGVIVAGPVAASIADSGDPTIYNWWNVHFDSGMDGHMGEGTLIRASTIPSPIPVPTPSPTPEPVPVPMPTMLELSVNGVVKTTAPIGTPLIYKINTNRKTATIQVIAK